MVGVRRSTGCTLCVSRRVKCDQAVPACGNCAKYGAACPGYDRGFKFVAEKHQVRSSRRDKNNNGSNQRGHATTSPAASASGSASDADPSQAGGAALEVGLGPGFVSAAEAAAEARGEGAAPVVVLRGIAGRSGDLVQLFKPLTGEKGCEEVSPGSASVPSSTPSPLLHEATRICDSPKESRAQFVANVLGNLETRSSEIKVFAPWFAHVHEHLGNSVALDSAMAAFALHLLGKGTEDQRLIRESRSVYGQSLVALQRNLNHPAEWRSSETLCSTMILCQFELFAGTGHPDSWKSHANGVAWLIQQRGAEAHRNPFDRAMLLSFRGIITMNSLFSGQDCFLAKRTWQRVLSELTSSYTTDHTLSRDLTTLSDLYHAHLARLPSVLRHGYALREAARHGLAIDVGDLAFHGRRAGRLRADFLAWYTRFQHLLPAPVEVPSQDPSSPFATVFAYANPWGASVVMGYWASMLIVQEALNRTVPGADYGESNRVFCENILRSLETVGKGYMGAYRVGYPMRIAYEFCNVREQMWVGTLLRRYETHYAAVSEATYPVPGSTTYPPSGAAAHSNAAA